MINRIRDIRRELNLTLADVAARCVPPTTAQTIGRLETGTRQLSLTWMNRIALALGVEPELLLRRAGGVEPRIVARLGAHGAEALPHPRDALLPAQAGGDGPLLVLLVDNSSGEYRPGDQVWMRQIGDDRLWGRHNNRDVLVPRPAGRFAFGRLIDHDGRRVAVLPTGLGQRQIVIENAAWLAVAEMLVRRL